MNKKRYIPPTADIDDLEAEQLLTTFSTNSTLEGPVGAKPHGMESAIPPASPKEFSPWGEAED